MIKGRVNAHHEALVPLPLRGTQGEEHAIEAVIDTGYNGFLTLPSNLIELLGFPFLRSSRAILGDGSTIEFDIHEATVVLNGRLQRVPVDAAEAILSVLEARGIAVSEAQRQEVLRCADVARLDRWARRAALAASTAEVIANS
jgi:clan AA aspartic protease